MAMKITVQPIAAGCQKNTQSFIIISLSYYRCLSLSRIIERILIPVFYPVIDGQGKKGKAKDCQLNNYRSNLPQIVIVF